MGEGKERKKKKENTTTMYEKKKLKDLMLVVSLRMSMTILTFYCFIILYQILKKYLVKNRCSKYISSFSCLLLVKIPSKIELLGMSSGLITYLEGPTLERVKDKVKQGKKESNQGDGLPD